MIMAHFSKILKFCNGAVSSSSSFSTETFDKLKNVTKDSTTLPSTEFSDSNSLEDFESEEIKLLQGKLADLESRYNKLVYEHEQTNIDLTHEKNKVAQLERQLQFVKDNQAVFEKLRETYISMKYTESSGRKLVEIRDKSVQTWDGILCRACLDTEKLRAELEHMKSSYDGCIIVKRNEIEGINKTIEMLRNYTKNNDEVDHPIKSAPIKNTHNVNRNSTAIRMKRKMENDNKRRGNNIFRSQSADRASRDKLNLSLIRTYRYKISKSSIDIAGLNCGVNKKNISKN